MPLLVEIRCFPANGALGLNFMDVSLATPPPPAPPPITQPAFRAYSAGGYNTVGDRVEVQPDLEATPKGGFNAASIPPGLATATGADNVFYMGQIDTVVRVSRVHSVWLDAGQASTWLMPVMVPSPQEQPLGTEIQLDFRTATGFQGSGRDSGPYDSTRMTAYGESAQTTGGQGWTVQNQSAWSSNIASATGRRYLQVRFTFVNNLATGLSPELLAVAFPYSFTP